MQSWNARKNAGAWQGIGASQAKNKRGVRPSRSGGARLAEEAIKNP
jgi:hypothetical protein